jgi:hypothetical protein
MNRRLQVLLQHIKPSSTNNETKKKNFIAQIVTLAKQNDVEKIKVMAKHFSMVEIIITVAIVASFSTVASTSYYKRIQESKIVHAKIELNQILQTLIFYYATHGKYPKKLNEISETMSTSLPLLDPWKQPYMYFPRVDWLSILEMLDKNQSVKEVQYWIECLQVVAQQLSELPESIDPMYILTLCSNQPLVISTGFHDQPVFPSDVKDPVQLRDQIRQTAQIIKTVRERPTGNVAVQHVVDQVINNSRNKLT